MTTPPNETPPDSRRLPDATCSPALVALYEQYSAAIEEWFAGQLFDGEKERLMEVLRLHAAIKEERARDQCRENASGTAAATTTQPDTQDEQ